MNEDLYKRTMESWCRVQWQILFVQAIVAFVLGVGLTSVLYLTSRSDMSLIIQRLDAIEKPLHGIVVQGK